MQITEQMAARRCETASEPGASHPIGTSSGTRKSVNGATTRKQFRALRSNTPLRALIRVVPRLTAAMVAKARNP